MTARRRAAAGGGLALPVALTAVLGGCAGASPSRERDDDETSSPRHGTALAARPANSAPGAPARAPARTAARTVSRDEALLSPWGDAVDATPLLFDEPTPEGRALAWFVVGDGPDTLLILGGIHGDEASSARLAWRFLSWASGRPALLGARRLVVAPAVNPDGLAAATRQNARGVDLNRNFSAANWRAADPRNRGPGPQPASEPETRFVLALLERYRPARVVSIHAAAACVNYDGPAAALAHFMGRACGLPPKASIGYATPGSLGSFLGVDRAVPIVTLELATRSAQEPPRPRDLQALAAALFHPGLPPTDADSFGAAEVAAR
jgi:protein MpaA